MYFVPSLSCGINNLGIDLSRPAVRNPSRVRRDQSASLMNNRSNNKKSTSLEGPSNHTPQGNEKDPVSEPRIQILLVDDHTIVREALASLLALDPEIRVIGAAGNGTDALRLIETLHPDIVLLDLSLPGMHGTEIIRQARFSHPAVKCLVLTVHMSEPIVRAALHSGAAGYLLKESSFEELRTAIHSVARGQTYLSPMITDKVLTGYLRKQSPQPSEGSPWQKLSDREREVLKLVAEGATSKEIAENLCISVRTVEKHRASLMAKLNLRTTAGLTAYAIKNELVTSVSVLKLDILSEENS
jgi:DNA-binding NarL/FixJ family response regulator